VWDHQSTKRIKLSGVDLPAAVVGCAVGIAVEAEKQLAYRFPPSPG
jgi:hypothetical protein